MDALDVLRPRITASGAGNDAFSANDLPISHETIRNYLRMLHRHGVVGDHPWDQYLPLGKLHLLPDTPLVLVPRVGRLKGIRPRLYHEDEVDDLLERGVRQV